VDLLLHQQGEHPAGELGLLPGGVGRYVGILEALGDGRVQLGDRDLLVADVGGDVGRGPAAGQPGHRDREEEPGHEHPGKTTLQHVRRLPHVV
jgi:hypothetical protein